MTNILSNKQQRLHKVDDGNSSSTTPQRVRKLDKVREFLGFPRSRTKDLKGKAFKQSLDTGHTPQVIGLPLPTSQATGLSIVASRATRQPIVASQLKNACSGDNMPISSHAPSEKPLSTPPPLTEAKRVSVFFTQNLTKPAFKTDIPVLLDRIEKTEQLVYCNTLLVQASSLTTTAEAAEGATNTTTATIALQTKPTLTDKELKWLAEMDKNTMEKAHIRWLVTRMVEEFIQDPSKDSVKIAEIVALGPVLGRGPYRKLLSSIIGGFEDARILDADLLQGLIQLVQSSSPGFLVSDDLVKIFSVLRIRLQGTHQQSLQHSFHLTLAISRVLDVMAEHEVKDLDRVEEHEPLSRVLSELKGSSDPYLMYQACYAFQALQYVPDDETALQAVLRHSTSVIDGLVKVSAVFKLDLGSILEGLGKLQEALGVVVGTASAVYEGVCTVVESGQGVLSSLTEVLGSGTKLPWYAAIRAAHALVQAGQLKDLHRLIFEAPCRRDPLFQWGICQVLGEIATDALWDTTIRQQAIELLGELYQHDPEWGRDVSVKTWMLNIINQLSTVDDQIVSTGAYTLLKELKQIHVDTTSLPYPLRNRLPLPASSAILARVQNIPLVEYDLHKLRLQRLGEHKPGLYIPPQAKPSLQASDSTLFPLMEKALEFLASHRQVFLVLGDSGAGKSTFSLKLEYTLWKGYKHFGPIPLFINLPTIDDPAHDLVEKQLRYHNFSDVQIQEMKLHREFVLICDGYDESQLNVNLHVTNHFNQRGQWKVKVIISCRSQYLGQDYRSRFQPQSADHYQDSVAGLFQEAVVAAFSLAQIRQYVVEYVKGLSAIDPLRNQPSWTVEEYMDKLVNIPHLLELVSNPFLLSLSLDALPAVVESQKDLSAIQITRVQLYDSFVERWIEVNRRRLQDSPLSDAERSQLDLLVEDNFFFHSIQFQRNLSKSVFLEHAGNPIIQYTHLRNKSTWKAAFFAPDGQVKLLRESSTVTRSGSFFRFLHRSLLEYFYSRTIIDPFDFDMESATDNREPACDLKTSLARMDIIKEPTIVQFLAERLSQDASFKQQLLDIVEESKASAAEKAIEVAAANAISILVKAGVLFNSADLRGIRIAGADLSDGQFDSAQLQGADLTGVILSRSWLRQADLSGARLEGVQFGELPYLDTGDAIHACAYSPDGRMLSVCFGYDGFNIYDTLTWTVIHGFTGVGWVLDTAFSPDNLQIVSAGDDGSVRTWDCTGGEEVLSMSGHTKTVRSVAFSPCGKRIASASNDGAVRLWDSQAGESLFVLEGHSKPILNVKYSPDGRQLVTGSKDETIRFWDPETGEPGVVLSPSLGVVHSLAYSPDGRWISSGHDKDLQLWNAATREPGPVLRGHSAIVTGIEFSPNGQWIVSSSYDKKVRLWDAYSGAPLSVWAGHGSYIECVAFSSDGFQIASGGEDNRVRLWELSSSPSSLDRRSECVDQIAYAPDGRTIVAQAFCRIFRRWDTGTGALSECYLMKFSEPQSVSCIAFTSDFSLFAVGYRNGSIYLCIRQTVEPVMEGHTSKVCMLVYSPCCRWIASVDEDNTVRLWNIYNTEQHRLLVEVDFEPEGTVRVLVFSPNGDQLAVGSEFRTVRLFDLLSTKHLTFTELTERRIVSMVYSPKGRQMAIGTEGGCIYLWDLQSEKPGVKLSGHRHWVQCVAYSPCGQWIASGSYDNTVGIWHRQFTGEVESWSRVHSISSFFGSVNNVAWNPLALMEFVTGCEDGSVRLWRMSYDDEGNVTVNMLSGSNLGKLCADGLVFDNDTGLSPVNKQLLVQRGAVSPITAQGEQE